MSSYYFHWKIHFIKEIGWPDEYFFESLKNLVLPVYVHMVSNFSQNKFSEKGYCKGDFHNRNDSNRSTQKLYIRFSSHRETQKMWKPLALIQKVLFWRYPLKWYLTEFFKDTFLITFKVLIMKVAIKVCIAYSCKDVLLVKKTVTRSCLMTTFRIIFASPQNVFPCLWNLFCFWRAAGLLQGCRIFGK